MPNRGCLCLCSNKDVLACGFTDGHIRFYELAKNTELGACSLSSFAITSLQFLSNSQNLIAGDLKGDVYMVRVEAHLPLRTVLAKIIEASDRIWELKVGHFEPLSTWGMACQGRIFKIWKRKDIYRVMNEQEEQEKMADVRELEYYLIDNFTENIGKKEVALYDRRRESRALSSRRSSRMWCWSSPTTASSSPSATTKSTL